LNTFEQLSKRVNRLESGCWAFDSPYNTPKGYYRARWKNERVLVHRLMWELFVGPVPDGKMILHRCDNTGCINPFHLRVGTNADNIKEAAQKNRMVHKLSLPEVRQILKLRGCGLSQREIGKTFGITGTNVGRIWRKTRRPHVTCFPEGWTDGDDSTLPDEIEDEDD
jgi:hypothetical protein